MESWGAPKAEKEEESAKEIEKQPVREEENRHSFIFTMNLLDYTAMFYLFLIF